MQHVKSELSRLLVATTLALSLLMGVLSLPLMLGNVPTPFGAHPALAQGPISSVAISGTTSGMVNTTYNFITMVDVTATIPITYVWEATNQSVFSIPNIMTTSLMMSYTWATAGQQWITVTAENTEGIAITSAGYGVMITTPVVAIPLNSATVNGPTTGMVNTLYNYSVITDPITATTPISYIWSPMPNSGQGTPDVTYQWASAGLQTIVVTASNITSTVNGFYSITVDSLAVPLNSATINGPTTGMVNTLYNYSVITDPITATTPISYNWWPTPNSGQGTPDVTYSWPSTGVYSAVVTVNNITSTVNGFYTITIDAPIIPLNSAAISGPTSGMVNTLYNYSVITDPITATQPISYVWNPTPISGDGTSNATYQWPNTGVYSIDVTVNNITNSVWAAYSVTVMGIVTPTSINITGPITGLANTTYPFSSTINPISATAPITYTWTPAPTSGQGSAAVTYLWATTGTQTMTVVAQNVGGVVSNSHTITLGEASITGLSATNNGPTSRGSATTLQATVTTGSNISYTWNFGDGTTGSGVTVNHIYTVIGSYNAIVTASNSINTATTTTTVSVLPAAITGLAASNNGPTALGGATTLNATVTTGDNVSYSWNFGDGTTGSGAAVNHTYALGSYNATVTASNSQGSATASTTVIVSNAPITGLSASNNSPTIIGNATTLNATITGGSNVVYNWSFGDGLTATGISVNHAYTTVGTYTAIVTASNTIGAVAANTTVVIQAAPISDTMIVGLTASNDGPKVVNSPVALSALVSAGSGISYSWTFGDGTTGSGATVTHSYAQAGIFTATVTVRNSINTLIATVLVTILNTPIAGLTASNNGPTALGDVTTLNATVTAGDGVTYRWDFGDGSSGSGAVVSHTYSTIGSYTAVVSATNTSGSQTATTVVSVVSPVSLSLSKSAPVSVQQGNPIEYTLTVFNNGLKSATNLTISDPMPLGATYLNGGTLNGNTIDWTMAELPAKGSAIVTFTVMASDTVINENYSVVASGGYSATGQAVTVTIVKPNPISGLVVMSDSPTLFGGMTHFTATTQSGDNVAYQWDFGDGTTANGLAVQHTYAVTGSYTVTVVASNAVSVVTKTVMVSVLSNLTPDEGTIEGVVMGDGRTLSGIYVYVYRYNNDHWNWANGTQTDNNGHYQFFDLPVGMYRMGFFDWQHWPSQYPAMYYQNASDLDSATDINLTSSAKLTINGNFQSPGRITGVVKDPTGQPLSGISVQVMRYSSTLTSAIYGGSWGGWAQTDSDGSYQVSGLNEGIYQVSVQDWRWPNRQYPAKYYQNTADAQQATPVQVMAGQTTTGIDVSMGEPGRITGKVTNQAGNPLTGVYVQVMQHNGIYWQWAGYAQTDGNGQYQIEGLGGTYRVGFFDWQYWPGRYPPLYYPNNTTLEESANVVVNSGETLTDINAVMLTGGHVKGKVVDSNGNPVTNLYVVAHKYNKEWRYWEWASSVYVNGDGNYELNNLNGTYRLGFYDYSSWPRRYQTQYYPQQSEIEKATDLAVPAGSDVTANMTLRDGSHIKGRVTDRNGNPVPYVSVVAYQYVNYYFWWGWWNWVNSVHTDADGRYDLSSLTGGTYRLSFSDDGYRQYFSIFYPNSETLDNATDVTVADMSTVSDVNITLSDGGHIAGVVTDESGNPLPNISIYVQRRTSGWWSGWWWEWGGWASTDAEGRYDVGRLKNGNYVVQFNDWSYQHISEYHSNALKQDDAKAVPVVLGETSYVDAQLASPPPPLAEVTSENGYVAVDPQTGQVTFNQINSQKADITITKAVTCTDNSQPSEVKLWLDSTSYAMSHETGSDQYSATIPQAEVKSGNLKVTWTCGGQAQTETVGKIQLYDPSGYVTNIKTGEPVVGAVVLLYKVPEWRAKLGPSDEAEKTCQSNLSKAPGEPWTQAAPVQLGQLADPNSGEIDPAANPLITDNRGHYAWDVAAGCWYITVEADGYESLVSPVVGVPSAVTDLDLKLVPLDIPTVQFSATEYQVNESVGSATVTVTLSTALTQTVTVNYAAITGTATIGSDYMPVTGTVTFAHGSLTQTFKVTILNDKLKEIDETINLALSNATHIKLGTPHAAVLTIVDSTPKVNVIYLPVVFKK